MKVAYSDLISPMPYKTNIGSIQSPTLKEIWKLGYETYNFYLRFLVMTPDKYCQTNPALQEWFSNLSDNDKAELTMVDICTIDSELANILQNALDFFFVEKVTWNQNNAIFVLSASEDEDSIKNIITSSIYRDVISVICQFNGLSIEENVEKIKSNKAKDIMKKLLAGRKKMQEKQTYNRDNELDNLVSAVANRHPSLNITNIWNLTISQFWDTFSRMVNNSVYDLSLTRVSVWGDESKLFKITDWYSHIKYGN